MPWGQWIQEGQDNRGPASRETVQAVSTDCWIRAATAELEINKRLRQFPRRLNLQGSVDYVCGGKTKEMPRTDPEFLTQDGDAI